MRDKSVSTAERVFASDCVAIGRRIDGRSPTESRRVAISLGPSWGFAEISFDNTLVVASTSVDPITPSPDRPAEGTLSIAMQLSPTSSELAARDSLGRTAVTHLVTETRNCIDKFVRDSRAIDTEALCILAGIKVWAVRVDVDVINDDGNCIDACVMAIMSSLMHARRPDVTVTGKEVRIHSVDEREPVPLPIHHVPLSVSFALFGAGKPYEPDLVVMDPVKKEEIASAGALSFAFNAQGEVCGVYKAGGLPLHHDSFVKCSELGEQRALKLTALLKQSLSDASAQHPLATVRPMLVNPEPVAQIKSRGAARADKDQAMRDAAPASMWNATPVQDTLPPPPTAAMDSNPVKIHTIDGDGVDAAVQSIFGSTGKVVEAVNLDVEKKDEKVVEVVDLDVPMSEVAKSEKKEVDTIDISDTSSSEDDLASAIISKPRGGRGRT